MVQGMATGDVDTMFRPTVEAKAAVESMAGAAVREVGSETAAAAAASSFANLLCLFQSW